ncbi:MAG TPA: AraC family transcriptional regulator [Ruminiclostridium sp.]
MQDQSYINCRIEHNSLPLSNDFPVSFLGMDTHSPSTAQVTYMHYHDSIELGYCFKGCGLFFINDKVLSFSAGDACIIFPDEIHIAQSDQSEPSQWKFINIDPLRLLHDINIQDLNILSSVLKQKFHVKNIFFKDDELGLNRYIHDLFCELEQGDKNYKSIIKSLTWSIFIKLSRINPLVADDQVTSNRKILSKIAPALMHISENYMNSECIVNISEKCNISASHFRRIFTSSMNISPSEYLYNVRIRMASILLINTNKSILEISEQVGYATLSSFNRHFKRIMEIAPKDWRKGKRTS